MTSVISLDEYRERQAPQAFKGRDATQPEASVLKKRLGEALNARIDLEYAAGFDPGELSEDQREAIERLTEEIKSIRRQLSGHASVRSAKAT